MIRYADSSAVLAWLLGEPAGRSVERAIRTASGIVASDLTVIECDRALHRLAAGDLSRTVGVGGIRSRLADSTTRWTILPISAPVVERARASFPDNLVRALDAIHLATALVARESVGELEVVSLDSRVRTNAEALGLRVLPA